MSHTLPLCPLYNRYVKQTLMMTNIPSLVCMMYDSYIECNVCDVYNAYILHQALIVLLPYNNITSRICIVLYSLSTWNVILSLSVGNSQTFPNFRFNWGDLFIEGHLPR